MQKQYAQSVSSIAESMGLPTWFVDLRHAGTHDHLPTLSLLRNGAVQALEWLNVNYWQVQIKYKTENIQLVRNTLSEYIAHQMQLIDRTLHLN
jgi:hypothetical protein